MSVLRRTFLPRVPGLHGVESLYIFAASEMSAAVEVG